jgi:hypothetical protein|tara:strand:+ start:123 stop:482 length:360 start_codon:yes stop_codon:yes gene_type:complete
MSSQESTDFLTDLTDEEVNTLNIYIDKCAEEGVEPSLEGLVMESEKFAEEFNGAFALGQQLAQTSFTLAGQVSERSDVPHDLVKSASGRYEGADFALNLADMAQAAYDTVVAMSAEENE